MAASVYSRAVQKAADLLGGRERLAKALQAPIAEIESWIADRTRPSREVFLRVVDIMLDESGPAGGGESLEPPSARDCATRSAE